MPKTLHCLVLFQISTRSRSGSSSLGSGGLGWEVGVEDGRWAWGVGVRVAEVLVQLVMLIRRILRPSSYCLNLYSVGPAGDVGF